MLHCSESLDLQRSCVLFVEFQLIFPLLLFSLANTRKLYTRSSYTSLSLLPCQTIFDCTAERSHHMISRRSTNHQGWKPNSWSNWKYTESLLTSRECMYCKPPCSSDPPPTSIDRHLRTSFGLCFFSHRCGTASARCARCGTLTCCQSRQPPCNTHLDAGRNISRASRSLLEFSSRMIWWSHSCLSSSSRVWQYCPRESRLVRLTFVGKCEVRWLPLSGTRCKDKWTAYPWPLSSHGQTSFEAF